MISQVQHRRMQSLLWVLENILKVIGSDNNQMWRKRGKAAISFLSPGVSRRPVGLIEI